MGSYNLTLNSSLTESGTNHDAVLTGQLLFYVFLRDLLGVDESQYGLIVIVGTCLRKALTNTLICILKVVLANQTDVNFLRGFLATIQETSPRSQCRFLSDGFTQFLQYCDVQSLVLHVYGNLIDAG